MRASRLEPHEAAAAIHDAAAPKCPRFAGYWAISTGDDGTRKASGIRCKSRRCSWCSRFVALASYAVLADGIAKAQAKGERVRFMTLTDTAAGEGDVRSFYEAWTRLAARLRSQNRLGEYARVLEVTKKLKPHLHVVLADSERGGGFIPQAELSKMAAAVGFGSITDIRAVGEIGEPCASLAGYFTKQTMYSEAMELVAYCGKQTAERLADLGAARVRPLSLSRKWYGGGIRAAESELMQHWYGRSDETTFEVWNARELGDQLHRLEAMQRAALRLVSSNAKTDGEAGSPPLAA
jgi:hypothetical protein